MSIGVCRGRKGHLYMVAVFHSSQSRWGYAAPGRMVFPAQGEVSVNLMKLKEDNDETERGQGEGQVVLKEFISHVR